MKKQIQILMDKLRNEGYINQLEELNEAVQSGDMEYIQEEINCSLDILGIKSNDFEKSEVNTESDNTIEVKTVNNEVIKNTTNDTIVNSIIDFDNSLKCGLIRCQYNNNVNEFKNDLLLEIHTSGYNDLLDYYESYLNVVTDNQKDKLLSLISLLENQCKC